MTEYESSIQIVMINEKAFKKYIKELGLKEEDSDKIAILGDDMLSYNEDGSKKINNYYTVKEGENITVTINDKEKDIKISKKQIKDQWDMKTHILVEVGCLYQKNLT